MVRGVGCTSWEEWEKHAEWEEYGKFVCRYFYVVCLPTYRGIYEMNQHIPDVFFLFIASI